MKKPLVVDLDGTLIKTDMLYESASLYLLNRPLHIIRFVISIIARLTNTKYTLAQFFDKDVGLLPYNNEVLGWLSSEKQNRLIVLATATHEILAERIARHTGLFDSVIATNNDINMKGVHKSEILVRKYGSRGFDYIGNSYDDLYVWAQAEKSYYVGSSPDLIRKIKDVSTLDNVFSNGKNRIIKSTVKLLRVHQWVKNILIAIPLLTAHRLLHMDLWVDVIVAIIAFSFTASSVYVLNDISDLWADRNHPKKMMRPLAVADISLIQGWIYCPLLLIAGYLIAYLNLPHAFLATLTAYYTITILYTFKIKKILILDVITLSILYTLRIVAGACVISSSLSFWLLGFSFFIFCSLAFIKRASEIILIGKHTLAATISGRAYSAQDLTIITIMGCSTGYISVLLLSLYVQDPNSHLLYKNPDFIMIACPAMFYWISRIWMLTYRGYMHEDPIVFSLKDPVSWAVGFLVLTSLALAALI